MIQPTLEKLDDVLIVDANVDAAALLTGPYQTFIAQPTQLVGYCRLGQPDVCYQITYIHLSIH